VVFHDCGEVDVVFEGPSNDAGFVQVMQGRAKDQDTMRSRLKDLEPQLRTTRPDVLGVLVAWHGDGGFTQAVFFRSEQEARDNERAMANSELARELQNLLDGEMTFYDFTTLDPD
jgi:hypothetical protein